ncbi:Dabb family protein [Yinghuangia sp. ASG 101]|uniref:Dabb family protein n=1 Tax=Yinghuangia sp. ASG 101 TaxID=2896848 RepID=UPI001E2E2766|nr:Dabb family protein [Yinghuangia sp. ASG 101]UGQ09134.1 Dabb family protein [Yinghuangia sp. ASG 101]
MIYHQVRMSIKPDAPQEDVEHALELMRRLGRELDVVEHFVVGRDFGGEFTYGASYALKDIDAYRTYLYAPLHRQIDEAGLPLVANMVSFDITDDDDPEFKARIDKLHADRFAGDSGLSDLIDGLGSYQGSGTDTQ